MLQNILIIKQALETVTRIYNTAYTICSIQELVARILRTLNTSFVWDGFGLDLSYPGRGCVAHVSCVYDLNRMYKTYIIWCRPLTYICLDPLTLSQCTLAGPVYTGMPLECHWLTQCTLGYHWATQRIFAWYTGTPLEKLSWNSPHWNTTGETLTFAAYTGTPLEGLWQAHTSPDTYS